MCLSVLFIKTHICHKCLMCRRVLMEWILTLWPCLCSPYTGKILRKCACICVVACKCWNGYHVQRGRVRGGASGHRGRGGAWGRFGRGGPTQQEWCRDVSDVWRGMTLSSSRAVEVSRLWAMQSPWSSLKFSFNLLHGALIVVAGYWRSFWMFHECRWLCHYNFLISFVVLNPSALCFYIL